MSHDGPGRETNADRILAIQKLLPPAKNVTSRTGYASLDELARRLKTNRGHLIKWKNGTEPLERHRNALAKLSQGRYTPDDFKRPSVDEVADEIRTKIAALEERLRAVENGERATDKELRSQLAALETEAQTAQADLGELGTGGPAESQGEPG